jgi:hypothetical protein
MLGGFLGAGLRLAADSTPEFFVERFHTFQIHLAVSAISGGFPRNARQFPSPLELPRRVHGGDWEDFPEERR